MNLQQRIEILGKLATYISAHPSANSENGLEQAIHIAHQKNNWFTKDFIHLSLNSISSQFLQKELLEQWAAHYFLDDSIQPKTVGIVMAGNLPLVGFHDFLSVFLSGHLQIAKLSSKDDVLLKHLVDKMTEWNPEVANVVKFEPMLKSCDAYIATGSDNTARYFHHYFGRYPSIIRKNRTSVALLTGTETPEELEFLADDIMLYFGLGCRNVTHIYVPDGYDFIPLLNAMRKYSNFFDHHKYRSNYDYQLAIYLMNNMYYMTNDCIVLVENKQHFSPIGSLHYSFYKHKEEVITGLEGDETIQALVGKEGIPFGKAQQPGLMDYADGVDVMQFLLSL
jgi:hypothetical protein